MALPLLCAACGANTASTAEDRAQRREPGPVDSAPTENAARSPGVDVTPTDDAPPRAVPAEPVLITPPAPRPERVATDTPPPPTGELPRPCLGLDAAHIILPPDDDLFLDEPPIECGNGVVEGDEACDDGNLVGGCSPDTWDGCNNCVAVDPGFICEPAACTPIYYCGDYRVTDAETCDDGNSASGDGCSSTCTREETYECPDPGKRCWPVERCGDGLVSRLEECDDGNTSSLDGCSSSCTLEPGWHCGAAGTPCAVACEAVELSCDAGPCPPSKDACEDAPYCGDGVVDSSEECDLGKANGLEACTLGCRVAPRCGDGVVQPGEECDLGEDDQGRSLNTDAHGICTPDCTLLPRCGDGIAQFEAGEECDDGNHVNSDTCTIDCLGVPIEMP